MPKKILFALAALAVVPAAFAATPALAEDAPAPTPAFTINGGATLVSDYRFRGISQTDKRFAVQGTFTIGHESGVYATVWGSSIDDYVANGGDQEIDLIVGYKHTFEGGTTLDGGLLYYYYPGSHGANTDFAEPYLSVAHTFGPVTAKLTGNYAPSQKALTIGNGKEDNFYLAGDLSAGIPDTGLALAAHFGHSFGPSYLTIGKEYSDWNLGATYTWKNLTIGAQYVDADGSFITPTGRNASKAGFVGTLGVAF